MIEVEVKAKVSNPDVIKESLKRINARFLKSERQMDKIFGHPMFLDSDNMIIEGGLVPRIRVVGDKKTLEFKEIQRKGGGMELKSELSDIDIGVRFLKKLGFIEAFTVSKLRESYSYEGFVISLDNVDKLGRFIEIEKMVDSLQKKEKAREECIRLLDLLYPSCTIEDRKYGDLIQEIINKERTP
jgi:adenylate cyclase class 2